MTARTPSASAPTQDRFFSKKNISMTPSRRDLFALSLCWACRSNLIYCIGFHVLGWHLHACVGCIRSLTYFLLSLNFGTVGTCGLLGCMQAACLPLINFRVFPATHAIGCALLFATAISRQPRFLAIHVMITVLMTSAYDMIVCACTCMSQVSDALVLSGLMSIHSPLHHAIQIACMLGAFFF